MATNAAAFNPSPYNPGSGAYVPGVAASFPSPPYAAATPVYNNKPPAVTSSAPSAPAFGFKDAVIGAEVAAEHAECAICFEKLHSMQLGAAFKGHGRSCKHLLHMVCFSDWIRSNTSCPICRAPIDRIVPVPNPDADPLGWFHIVDYDGSKRLTKGELLEILQAQFPLDMKEAEKLVKGKEWQNWDPDNSGEIDYAELIEPRRGLLRYVRDRFMTGGTGPEPPMITKDRNAWYDFYDEDGSHTLSKEEILRAFIQTFHVSRDLRQVENMREVIQNVWCIFDTDGSGEIDKNEFLARDGLADTIIATLNSR